MDYRVYKVIAAVENDLAKNWTVDKLASLVNISPHHFHKIFRAETGSTPMQYLAMLRLIKARELLESTFLSIKEIRQAVGMPRKAPSRVNFGISSDVPRQNFVAELGKLSRSKAINHTIMT